MLARLRLSRKGARTSRAHRVTKVLVPIALMALVSQLGAGPALAVQNGWAPLGQVGLYPSNAPLPVYAVGASVACGTLGDCVGVGGYDATSSYEQPMTFQMVNGVEQQEQEAIVPGNADVNPVAQLLGVSCPAPSACTAVGTYTRDDSVIQAMVTTDVAGSWGQASMLPEPSDVGASGTVAATSVSCTSVGNCVAVGGYVGAAATALPLIETETNGTWAASSAVSQPADSMGAGELLAVSCPAAGDCTAVGIYENGASHVVGFELTKADGTWTQAEALAQPADVYATAPTVEPKSVSCWGPSNCMIVGAYTGPGDDEQGFGQFEVNGAFHTPTTAAAAGTEESPRTDSLNGVSCVAAQVCVAVGTFTDGSSIAHGFVEVYQFGGWIPEEMQDPPYFASAGDLTGVACAPSGSCVSTGSYSDGATL